MIIVSVSWHRNHVMPFVFRFCCISANHSGQKKVAKMTQSAYCLVCYLWRACFTVDLKNVARGASEKKKLRAKMNESLRSVRPLH